MAYKISEFMVQPLSQIECTVFYFSCVVWKLGQWVTIVSIYQNINTCNVKLLLVAFVKSF